MIIAIKLHKKKTKRIKSIVADLISKHFFLYLKKNNRFYRYFLVIFQMHLSEEQNEKRGDERMNIKINLKLNKNNNKSHEWRTNLSNTLCNCVPLQNQRWFSFCLFSAGHQLTMDSVNPTPFHALWTLSILRYVCVCVCDFRPYQLSFQHHHHRFICNGKKKISSSFSFFSFSPFLIRPLK